MKQITYYSWRKKAGNKRRRGRRSGASAVGEASLRGQVRSKVEARMAALLPQLVQAEVNRYLDKALGTGRRG